MDKRHRGSRQADCWSALEVSDKSDFRFKSHAEFFLDGILSDGDQLTNIFRSCSAEVYHDVGVNVRDLCVAVPETFQPALIDKTAGAHSFDFLEDRSSAWMKLKPGMPSSAPAKVFLHHLV